MNREISRDEAHAASSERRDPPSRSGLYLLHISVHGLLRGFDMELGKDADTGGQIKYVVELARALGQADGVSQVDLLTRQIIAKQIDRSYAQKIEPLGEHARIVRLACGPKRYIRKEKLWTYLDSFVDSTIQFLREQGRIPDVIHGHYADGGYVAAQLSRLFGVPCVFTGHSLGRVKRQRLLDKGQQLETIEKRYNFPQRIEAEEMALDTASLVVASTAQEVEEQYKVYDNYQTRRMKVIPPGVDLERFSAPSGSEWSQPIAAELKRFLRNPTKPMILAIARADDRKNFPTLVTAFAEHPKLREIANLVLVAGNRDDLRDLNHSSRRVLRNLMMLIDQYDLYGSVAYPKQHKPEEVPILYRLAAETRGLFVNPALTEPFGLTLIEAAASGLPIVATDDGGPRDIVGSCENGVLIDPLDAKALGEKLFQSLNDSARWDAWQQSGLERVKEHYSWSGHVKRYLEAVRPVVELFTQDSQRRATLPSGRLPRVDRLLLTAFDDTLGMNEAENAALSERLAGNLGVGLGYVTGRSLPSLQAVLEQQRLPMPDVIVAAAGTEIYYGQHYFPDRAWTAQIRFRWNRREILEALQAFPGITLQPSVEQSEFKISTVYEVNAQELRQELAAYLRNIGVRVNLVFSRGNTLDILPIRASTGLAIRYLLWKWRLAPERVLAVGASGNEQAMISGNTLGVVVSAGDAELAQLKGSPRVYFARKSRVWGIIEGIEHYDFLGAIRIPDEVEVDYHPSTKLSATTTAISAPQRTMNGL